MIIWDIETDGLLKEVTTIHKLVAFNTETKKTTILRDMVSIAEFIRKYFQEGPDAVENCGHNVIGYDHAVLCKLFPVFKPHRKVIDTLVLSRLIHADIKEDDKKLVAKGKLPGKLIGSHSLEAWGYRLGDHKGDFKGPWSADEAFDAGLRDCIEKGLPAVREDIIAQWLADMEVYCIQDVAVTTKLLAKLKHLEYSQEAVTLEHEVQWIIQRQVRFGVLFNQTAAENLYADLMIKRDEIEKDLKVRFGTWYAPVGKTAFYPKRDNKASGYLANVPFTKIEIIEFNPGSRQHIANRLQKLYGWKPESFTESGQVEVNEKILLGLNYLHVDKLLEFLLVEKRMSQIADGQQGWLKKVDDDGRIRGGVNSNGTVTGRMSHSGPNLGQVPKVGKPYGLECRSLFMVPRGKVMVGCDASALEGRTLSHYTARYDGGAYGKILLEGDVHWTNTLALGLVSAGTVRIKDENDPEHLVHDAARNIAKTWFYAWLYGAGDKKLAVTLKCTEAHAKGLRAAFLKNATALGALQKDIELAVKTNGHLKGIDGRIISIRSSHSALNALLQSCGAIIMKRALVILDNSLQTLGWIPGKDYEFLLNVHDEWQLETFPGKAEQLSELAISAIRAAGKYYKCRVPMDGEAKTGKTWAETH